MSERKVLNKYYPPDFDPSKIPRARCPRNRQFTVRLMVPCNIKCYTCGEYIAKGKKFNARKEDVENMTYLGVRIYRFYIKCPGCLSEISFRTDPESTDYVIEAGAHRNFQALKLAEEQAAREEREAKEEIESNPMLLLENRTQQSQYEMEVLESLEDLREMNERHAGIDLGKMTEKYEAERKLTQEQIAEAERMEALKALGYEMVEGEMIKRVAEDVDEEPVVKRVKQDVKATDVLTGGKSDGKKNMKAKLAGLIKNKSGKDGVKNNGVADNTASQSTATSSSDIPQNTSPNSGTPQTSKSPQNSANTSETVKNTVNSTIETSQNGTKPQETTSSSDSSRQELPPATSSYLSESSLKAITSTKPSEATKAPVNRGVSGLAFLGAYSDSDSGEESN